ncbi:MAG TPA: UDP-N-acetylmuramoyl-L-alanine--D-glutamate ligase [Steroidobacteraceae bacterium]|nr:UDP-N-acetylmuramoyl-L-alanine--D-glutamate ligase [Steroidobacteraceae bacterium]
MQAARNQPMHSAAGRTIVVGLGRTGLSCARYLRARGIPFAVTDSRATPPEATSLRELGTDIEMRFGGFDERLLEAATQVIASPGVSVREAFLQAAASKGLPIIGDIEVFAREARAPIVAITGTNGKSTVTTLVARMAEAAGRRVLAGGNLGRPALDLLNEPVPELYVLELSSFQLETTHSLRTAAATVLNVTSDHMDRYDSMQAYADAKARIFDRCDAAIVNLDDAYVRSMAARASCVLTFSLTGPIADFYAQPKGGDVFLMHRGERLVAMSELKISGLHNAANALAALAMCNALGIPLDACVDSLKTFPGLAHRSQWVADVNGIRFVDDSKGTNVGATLAAVSGMPSAKVLICGGQGKGQDFAPLAAAFRNQVRHVVLLGQDARLLQSALEGAVTTEFASDMDEAVKLAAQAARAGETVLLSPACASLDMFRDYAHRGDVFAAAVRRLA